jgi:hypothetical protein
MCSFTSAAGGLGDSIERDPALITADMNNGLTTEWQASNIYCVKADYDEGEKQWKADKSATRELRQAKRKERLARGVPAVVQKGTERVVKCDCGHEFGDWRQNWKLSALIFARDDTEKLEEIYPGIKCPDPDLCEVREFYCPTSGSMLMVEAVPAGYPLVFDALPDIDGFYREWLGRPLNGEKEFRDTTYDVTRQRGRDIK